MTPLMQWVVCGGLAVECWTVKWEARGFNHCPGWNVDQDFCFMRTPTPPIRPHV